MVEAQKPKAMKEEKEEEKKVEEEDEEKPSEDIHKETEAIKNAIQIVENFPKAKLEVQGLKIYQNIGTMYMQGAIA